MSPTPALYGVKLYKPKYTGTLVDDTARELLGTIRSQAGQEPSRVSDYYGHYKLTHRKAVALCEFLTCTPEELATAMMLLIDVGELERLGSLEGER